MMDDAAIDIIEQLGRTEETLQSIDSTLKRVEIILREMAKPYSISFDITKRNADDLVVKDDSKRNGVFAPAIY